MTDISFFEQLLIILAASLGIAILFKRIKLPTIVAYIVVGSILGPQATGIIADAGNFTFIAEFGIAFLLFAIGLEFSLPKMLSLKSVVFGLGFVQVLSCIIIFTGAVYMWGGMLEGALAIAAALALSSTAIVVHELSNQQQFTSKYAQLSIGVLLFQDLIAVLFLIMVPILGDQGQGSFGILLVITLFKGLVLFASLMAIGKWVLPRIYHEVARSGSEEIFVLSTLVIALLAAWITHLWGLSMTLGSFVIGMMLSESSFKHQINNDIRPFKDILLGLFFVSIGLNIELSLLQDYWFRIIYMTLGLILIKSLIIAVMVKLTGNTASTSVRTGLALAQAGEFSLALITLAYINNVLPIDQASFIIWLVVLSMLLSPFLIRHNQAITKYILLALNKGTNRDDNGYAQVSLHSSDHVLIGGFGRVGQTIAALLQTNEVPYIGLDKDIEVVNDSRARGNNVIYGDCTRIEILESCHIANARLAILTFRSVELARITIKQIRDKGIEVPIIVRCYEHGDFEELISIGADWVIPEMLEASLMISSQVLTILNIESDIIGSQIDEIRTKTLGNQHGIVS